MNMDELVRKVAGETDITQKDTKVTLNSALYEIMKAVSKGDKVTLMGFGSFSVSKRQARKGVNPRTMEEMVIKANSIPKFKAGKNFKEMVK